MRCRVCGRSIDKDNTLCPDCEADHSFIEYAPQDDDTSLLRDRHKRSVATEGDNARLEKHQNNNQTKSFKAAVDGLTVFLAFFAITILFGVIFLLIRQSVFPIFYPETDTSIFTESSVSAPSVSMRSDQPEPPVFVRDKVQLLPGEYIELREYLGSPASEDWVWGSSNSELISVNSAGIATSTVSGAVAEISVYSVTYPENRASIRVICLSDDAQHAISEIERLNAERYPFDVIDLESVRFEPAQRNTEAVWDGSVYSVLEDDSAGQNHENHISSYAIQRNRRICADNEHVIDYDIYRHPQSGVINRITATAYLWDDTMTITDYYYTDDGMPNYVCVQVKASPVSGATQSEHAEHLYFDQNMMVRRRTTDDQGEWYSVVVGEAEENTHYDRTRIMIYDEMDTAEQEVFDRREKEVINEAYITYYTLVQDMPVYRISGNVTDKEGQPVSDAFVTLIGNQHNGIDLYQVNTNARGEYSIFLHQKSSDYALRIEKEDYVTVKIHELSFSENIVDQFQEQVVLPEARNSNSQMTLLIADAMETTDEIVWQDSFDTETLRISFAEIYIRPGLGNTKGEYIAKVSTDGHGIANLRLPVGAYTAEVLAEGYLPIYTSVYVYPGRQIERIFMLPESENDRVSIMIMWQDTPKDLDLHMFTPHNRTQNALNYHVGFDDVRDLAGNQYHLDSRDGFGPETITINAFENGVYRIYATDYDICLSGNVTAQDMLYSQARVYVYTAEGEVFVFHVPVSYKGNIWAVFEIRNQTVIPTQRLYIQANLPQWCIAQKEDE